MILMLDKIVVKTKERLIEAKNNKSLNELKDMNFHLRRL